MGNWLNGGAINWEKEYRKGNWCNGRKIIFYYVDFKGEIEGERDISTNIRSSETTLVIHTVTKEP